MNKILLMSGIIALTAILVVPFSTHAVNAVSVCNVKSQTNEKSGSHTVGPFTFASRDGSCSVSVTSRAGQGSPHIRGTDAINDPGFRTATCTSASGSNAGFDSHFNDGQHSADKSCSASSHSP